MSRGNVFIGGCTIHPDLFVILANDRQLQELGQFCTNPRDFCVFGVEPTFNIFDKKLEHKPYCYNDNDNDN